MYVRYNSLNRHEPLIMTLCNPGSIYSNTHYAPTKALGILIDTSDEELCLNFNQLSELNFRVSRIHRDDFDDDAHAYGLYKSVQTRRLIYVTGIGYFIISNIDEGYDTDGALYKDVTAESVEAEIQNRKVPYIADGTYRFSSDDQTNTTGLLESLVATLPLWTIGYVDSAVASKYRTFEDVDTDSNILSFMLEDMQDAYECIFIFDITNRIVNVYDQNNYVRQTDIHITKHDLIRSLDISENSDDLYTAISVLGNENTSIAAINPLGTNVIYNFDHYLEWMSDELQSKVRSWQDSVDAQRELYYDINLQYYTKMGEASNYNLELQKIASQVKIYQQCRDNIVAGSSTDLVGSYNTVIIENGGTPIEVYEEIADTLAEIDNLIAICEDEYDDVNSSLNAVNAELSALKAQSDEIHQLLSFDNHFSTSEFEELCSFIFEGSYTDEHVVITDIMSYAERFEQMKILYDRAKNTLDKASHPTQEFNIDVENFLFAKEFANWSEQLETGCIINVELEQDDIAMLFLSNITVNYEDRTLSMTFGNRFNKFDTKSLFNNVLGKISKSANTIGYIKDIIHPIKNGEFNSMKDALSTSRNLTMGQALSSTNEEVIIDGSGYTGRQMLDSGVYDPRQVKLIGRNLVFTDDAWRSCKVAIGELQFGDGSSAYGVNADIIIGDMIIGNNIRILDNDGNELFTAVDGMIKSSVRNIEDGVTQLSEMIQGSDGILIRIQSLENNKEIDSVTTSTGYTFNADGLTIYRDGEDIKTLLCNTGMYVTRSDEEVLTADNTGVNAINLSARQFLIVGANSRFEDYSDGTDERRTACFYIGESGGI